MGVRGIYLDGVQIVGVNNDDQKTTAGLGIDNKLGAQPSCEAMI